LTIASRSKALKPSTGVHIYHVPSIELDAIYQEKSLNIEDLGELDGNEEQDMSWVDFPNVFVVLKSEGKSSALAQVSTCKQYLNLVPDYNRKPAYGLKPRNKEQNLYLHALMNPDIPCVIAEGRAGSGKTLVALAAGMELLNRQDNTYDKIILTRPMDPVGVSLGALPGDEKEKFLPYLGNFYTNFEQLMGEKGLAMLEVMMSKGVIKTIPIQLIGGSSWHNSFVIADEVQSLTAEQMYALGTRSAKGSKVVILGDSAQRYGKKEDVSRTGLRKLTESRRIHESPLVSYIELIKQERSPLADVFYDVFVEEAP
jgi:PhoH-like ATPase